MIQLSTKVILQEILASSDSPQVRALVSNLLDTEVQLYQLGIDDLFSQKTMETERAEEPGTKGVRDYRIKSIVFTNFRSIPDNDVRPYGVSFTREDGKPLPLFIVGRNSTGKTTLYSALEHHYVSDNSLSKEMNLDRESILTFGFKRIKVSDQKDVRTKVMMVGDQEKECSLESHQPYCSPAPFCSEYDLHQLGQQGERLYDYLLEQLGYYELAVLKQKLMELKGDIDKQLGQTARPSDAELTSKDWNEIIKAFTENHQDVKDFFVTLKEGQTLFSRDDGQQSVDGKNFFKEYWRNLYNLTQKEAVPQSPAQQQLTPKDKDSDSAELAIRNKIKNLYEIIENMFRRYMNAPTIDNFVDIMGSAFDNKNALINNEAIDIMTSEVRKLREEQSHAIGELVDAIEKEQFNVVELFCDQHFKMIDEIIEQISYNDGHLFISESKPNRLVVKVKDPLDTKGLFEATPQEYFNSFRFKLYAVSFKVALSFMEMQLKNIRVPIVIDDVFNASDFENNICLESFVYSIFKAYNSLKFEEPLQLILLTHDEMIQTAFRKGAQMANSDFICGRLFSYNIAKQMHGDLDAEDTNNLFYNLYMPN